METSEQCAYDSSVDTPDSSSLTSELVICKTDNNTEEIISQTQGHEVQLCDQIVGYIDETNSTLVLQAPVIGSDGKSAVLAEGNEGDEVLLILDPEDPGSYSENCIVNSTIEIQSESVSQEIVRSDVIQTIQFIPADDSGGTVYIQQPCEFTLVDSENNYISTENLTEIAGHAEFKDGKFFLDSETLKNLTSNKKILQIASVTDQVPSEIKLSNAESVVEIECPSSIHEGYVIFKETISLSNSSDVANFTLHTDNVNDDEKHSSQEDANDEILSTQKHPTSSHQRVVSVIHAPLSMNNSDNNLENSIESNSVSEECNKKDTFTVENNQIEKNDYSKEVSQSEILHTNYTTDSNSKKATNLNNSIQIEMLSFSDNSKESDIKSLSCVGEISMIDPKDAVNVSVNVEGKTVEDIADRNDNGLVAISCESSSSKNIDKNEWKEADSINNIDINSNTSMEIDQNETLDPTIKDQNNEIDSQAPLGKSCETHKISISSETAYLSPDSSDYKGSNSLSSSGIDKNLCESRGNVNTIIASDTLKCNENKDVLLNSYESNIQAQNYFQESFSPVKDSPDLRSFSSEEKQSHLDKNLNDFQKDVEVEVAENEIFLKSNEADSIIHVCPEIKDCCKSESRIVSDNTQSSSNVLQELNEFQKDIAIKVADIASGTESEIVFPKSDTDDSVVPISSEFDDCIDSENSALSDVNQNSSNRVQKLSEFQKNDADEVTDDLESESETILRNWDATDSVVQIFTGLADSTNSEGSALSSVSQNSSNIDQKLSGFQKDVVEVASDVSEIGNEKILSKSNVDNSVVDISSELEDCSISAFSNVNPSPSMVIQNSEQIQNNTEVKTDDFIVKNENEMIVLQVSSKKILSSEDNSNSESTNLIQPSSVLDQSLNELKKDDSTLLDYISKNRENELSFPILGEAGSEIKTCQEPTFLTLKDNEISQTVISHNSQSSTTIQNLNAETPDYISLNCENEVILSKSKVASEIHICSETTNLSHKNNADSKGCIISDFNPSSSIVSQNFIKLKNNLDAKVENPITFTHYDDVVLSKPTCSEEFDLSFNSDSKSSAFSDSCQSSSKVIQKLSKSPNDVDAKVQYDIDDMLQKSKSKLTHKQDSKIYTFSEATYLSSKDNSNIKNSALSDTSGSSLTENVGEFENNFSSQITNHSLKKDENELVSLNIDDANSEIHAGSEVTCLSFKDTSNAPSVVDSLRFSEDSLSSSTVIHNLSKSETSVHQNKESKNVIQYELETSSSNRELNNEGQKSGILHYSDDASTEIDVTKISHSTDSNGEIAPCNLTFHGALAPVIGEHENSKNALNNNDVGNLSENSYEIFSDAVKKSLINNQNAINEIDGIYSEKSAEENLNENSNKKFSSTENNCQNLIIEVDHNDKGIESHLMTENVFNFSSTEENNQNSADIIDHDKLMERSLVKECTSGIIEVDEESSIEGSLIKEYSCNKLSSLNKNKQNSINEISEIDHTDELIKGELIMESVFSSTEESLNSFNEIDHEKSIERSAYNNLTPIEKNTQDSINVNEINHNENSVEEILVKERVNEPFSLLEGNSQNSIKESSDIDHKEKSFEENIVNDSINENFSHFEENSQNSINNADDIVHDNRIIEENLDEGSDSNNVSPAEENGWNSINENDIGYNEISDDRNLCEESNSNFSPTAENSRNSVNKDDHIERSIEENAFIQNSDSNNGESDSADFSFTVKENQDSVNEVDNFDNENSSDKNLVKKSSSTYVPPFEENSKNSYKNYCNENSIDGNLIKNSDSNNLSPSEECSENSTNVIDGIEDNKNVLRKIYNNLSPSEEDNKNSANEVDSINDNESLTDENIDKKSGNNASLSEGNSQNSINVIDEIDHDEVNLIKECASDNFSFNEEDSENSVNDVNKIDHKDKSTVGNLFKEYNSNSLCPYAENSQNSMIKIDCLSSTEENNQTSISELNQDPKSADVNLSMKRDNFFQIEENSQAVKPPKKIYGQKRKIFPLKNNINDKKRSIDHLSNSRESVCIMDEKHTDSTFVKQPKRTYFRKRKSAEEKINKSSIELFSLDEFSNSKDDDTALFCESQKDLIENISGTEIDKNLTNEIDVEFDDLMTSNVVSRVSATYKTKRKPSQGNTKRTINLRSKSLSHVSKKSDLKDTDDSVRWGSYLMGASFKKTTTDDNVVSKTSLIDTPKKVLPKSPLKKRPRPSWYENAEVNSIEYVRQWDKFVKSLPTKQNASSEIRKARIKVKQQVETLRKSKNFNSQSNQELSSCIQSPPKKMKPSKDCDTVKTLNSPILDKDKKLIDKKIKNKSDKKLNSPILDKDKKLNSPILDKDKKLIDEVKISSDKKLNSPSLDTSLEGKQSRDSFKFDNSPSTSAEVQMKFEYKCSNCCNFSTNRANNLINHMKFCTKPSSDMIAYTENDMDRRELIRGENFSKSPADGEKGSSSQSLSSTSVMETLVLDESETLEVCGQGDEIIVDEEDDEESENDETENDKTGKKLQEQSSETDKDFIVKEIVWTKMNDRYWPSVIAKLNEKKATVFVIDYPKIEFISSKQKKRGKKRSQSIPGDAVVNVGLKIDVNEFHDHLHSFKDVTWNKTILNEAQELPYKDLFVKAVQNCDSYTRKQFLYNSMYKPVEFFNIAENVVVMPGFEDILEDICTPNTNKEQPKRKAEHHNVKSKRKKVNNELIDVKKLLRCIFDGQCNKHIISILKEESKSKRHNLFFLDKPSASEKLKEMSWFSPFKENATMQIELYEYFLELHEKTLGKKPKHISYIYEVLIPEGIIKAISIIKGIKIEEAEHDFNKPDIYETSTEDSGGQKISEEK